MSVPLLKTKLHMPQLRPHLVSRAHLLNCLNDNLIHAGEFTRKLTLIAAPAGYGKTTLATEWACGLKQPVAWLLLDESDNDPTRFLTYFIAALQGLQRELGQSALAMLQSAQTPPVEIILTTLLNEIETISHPFILTLDDYHVIHTAEIHQQLAYILDHQPAQMHLVLTTREDPLLPIARLRAQGQLLEIRQRDLRFTTREITYFLKKVMNLSLTTDEIAALERRTEGWIAGLQLAALSMQGRGDLRGFVQAFTGSSRYVLDYLIEEVFAQQSKDVQDFLVKTSILDRLSGSLCDSVAVWKGSWELLNTLERANLFIVPLDQSRTWYRYHRLFAELLRHRLRMFNGDIEVELHSRASDWFEQNGFTSEAIQHALSAKNWERATEMLQRVNTDMLKRGEVATLLHWYQVFPQEALLANPRLCFDYCWPLLLAGQFDVAESLLARVEQMVGDIPEFLGEIFAAQAYLARGKGDHQQMVDKSQRALALLPKSSVDSRGVVAMNLGLAYWHMGRMQATEEVLVEALEACQVTENHYAALTAMIFLGRVFAVRGQLHRATEYFERAISQGNKIPINALAHMDLATLHYEWNELDMSEMHLQKAIALCQQAQNDEFLVGARMIQSRLRIAQADFAGAEKALENAWELVGSGKIPIPTAERVDVAQAHLLLEKGEPTGEWEQKLSERVDCQPFYRFLGVTKARILPESHARAYLEGLSTTAQVNEWGYGWIAVRALQSIMAEDQNEALRYLSEALQRAESSRYIRVFVEVGEKLIPLLREAARRGITPDYAGQILAAMSKRAGKSEASLDVLVEPLSEREIEVLRLVTAGMSNREIAEKLVVSVGTVKTHVHHLCGKLGVRNRTEATTKARDLKLV